MTELFPVEDVTVKSPKLRFLERNCLEMYMEANGEWCCAFDELNKSHGSTEEEAILNYCERFRLKHYSIE